MIRSMAAGSLIGGTAFVAYSVRGRSSRIFGPSVYRGPRDRRAVALTFDDGPSESTPSVLELLSRYRAAATFFQCGANIRRLPAIARQVLAAGHEIGNHTDTHRPLYLASPHVILSEFERAQNTIRHTLGIEARWMRAPFGARWFGFREMQRRLGLTGVMWTVIGRDWTLDPSRVAQRILRRVANGSIICLHDGRELAPKPDLGVTLGALRRILPELSARGYRFCTVSQLLCPAN